MKKVTKHICLNMIVKNESHVIERCLASVKDYISSWAIVDTGSSDGTQEKIRAYLKDIPGTLQEKPWLNFAHNRTEALGFVPAEADYILIIDADEELHVDSEFDFPDLVEDGYYIQTRLSGVHYYRLQLVKNGLGWRWESKLHEYIISDINVQPAALKGIYNVPHPDGFRSSNPNKYKQDAITLEQAILEEPDNSRYFFYLAQSYRDCGDTDLAIRYYTRRVQMGGWREEVWYALYQIGLLKLRRGDAWEAVQMPLFDAFNYRPGRVEPLIPVIEYYRKLSAWPLANFFASQAVNIPYPDDLLFVETGAYSAKLWLEYAYILNGLGNHTKTIALCNAICCSADSAPELRQQALAVRAGAQDALQPRLNQAAFGPGKTKVVVKAVDTDLLMDNCFTGLLYQSMPPDEIYCVAPKDRRAHLQAYFGNLPVTIVEEHELQTSLKVQPDDLVLFLEGNSWLLYNHSLDRICNELAWRGTKIIYGQHLSENGLYANLAPQCAEDFQGHRAAEKQQYAWCLIRGECLPEALRCNIVNDKITFIENCALLGYNTYFIETSLLAVHSPLPEKNRSEIPIAKQLITT